MHDLELATFDLAVRGARVRYVDGGPREGPAVVFLHGHGRDHTQWLRAARALARRRRVIALDLPGFGASEPGAGRAAFEPLAEATLDLVAALQLGRVALVGHSLGGAVAIVAAADRPEFVERLVLVAPVCYRPNGALDERLSALPVVGPALFRRVLGGRILERQTGHRERPTTATWPLLRASSSPSTIEARVPRVRTETLVVWGREDPVAPWTHGTRLSRELGNARLEIFEGGRFPEAERPAAFEALVSEFLLLPEVDGPAGRSPPSRRGALR
jgi:pimeloyl-ACP methyl ester carboxylesterase